MTEYKQPATLADQPVPPQITADDIRWQLCEKRLVLKALLNPAVPEAIGPEQAYFIRADEITSYLYEETWGWKVLRFYLDADTVHDRMWLMHEDEGEHLTIPQTLAQASRTVADMLNSTLAHKRKAWRMLEGFQT